MTDEKNDTKKNLILDIEDEIIANFCEMNGGMEFAMPIVRNQYEKHNINFKSPTESELHKVVDALVEVTKNIKGEDVAKKEKKIFKELLMKLDNK